NSCGGPAKTKSSLVEKPQSGIRDGRLRNFGNSNCPTTLFRSAAIRKLPSRPREKYWAKISFACTAWMSKQQKSSLDTINNLGGGYDPPPLIWRTWHCGQHRRLPRLAARIVSNTFRGSALRRQRSAVIPPRS